MICNDDCQRPQLFGRARIVIASSRTTANTPDQSSCDSTVAVIRCAALIGEPGGKRRRKTPRGVGRWSRKIRRPKSLSKLTSVRSSSRARWSNCGSEAPGSSVRAQNTSCPRRRSSSTANFGMFSSASSRTPQPFVAKTSSSARRSLAYARQARMSSAVRPG